MALVLGFGKSGRFFLCTGPFTEKEQEQTMFDDPRRGFTEDFQGLTEFKRTFKDHPKKHQNISYFAFLAFLTSIMTSKFKFDLIRPT